LLSSLLGFTANGK